MPLAEGGEYPEWQDRMVPKHEQEVRFLFGVCMLEDGNGKMVGDRFKPFEYTGKTVLGWPRRRFLREERDISFGDFS
eukprot:4565361-Prymnesium_polylepis.1